MTSDDLFDDLYSFEDQFFKEGFELGVADGSHAGRVEGRVFGLEKGFEKFAAIGRLHGRASVWAGRLPSVKPETEGASKNGHPGSQPVAVHVDTASSSTADSSAATAVVDHTSKSTGRSLAPLPQNSRLRKHIETLYALSEPASLSTENNEDAVAEFDDRFKRAAAKLKIIERIVGEQDSAEALNSAESRKGSAAAKEVGEAGNIEDIRALKARR